MAGSILNSIQIEEIENAKKRVRDAIYAGGTGDLRDVVILGLARAIEELEDAERKSKRGGR